MANVDWGSAPDWLAAIGTVGALGVALYLLRQEMQERRRSLKRADRAPADQIFAWAQPRTDAGGWQTFVLNKSDEPVYDVVVRLTPLSEPPLPPYEAVWGTVAPGDARAGDSFSNRPNDLFGVPSVDVEFTDGRGRHWIRRAGGELEQLDHRAPFD